MPSKEGEFQISKERQAVQADLGVEWIAVKHSSNENEYVTSEHEPKAVNSGGRGTNTQTTGGKRGECTENNDLPAKLLELHIAGRKYITTDWAVAISG